MEHTELSAYRYAIYFAPSPDEPLAQIARRWLGRDCRTGAAVPQPAVEGVPPARLRQITAEARRYGFHATLKAPFRLAEGRDPTELRRSLREFTLVRHPFTVPSLVLTSSLGFPALVPAEPSADLDRLADDCVRAFDLYRASPTAEEVARRKARNGGLTPRQIDHLKHWGYPHVFEDFRFHMTLSGPIPDEDERHTVMAALADEFRDCIGKPLHVTAVCLFIEPEPGADFRLFCRDKFG